MSTPATIDREKPTRSFASTAAFIAAIFLSSRLALLAFAGWVAAHAQLPPVVPHDSWVDLLCRWDCGWYLGVAEHGYSTIEDPAQPGATNFAFFPVYPLLVRLAAPLFAGHMLAAAIAISNVCFFVALLCVHRYARLLGFSDTVALLCVTLLCLLPHTLALSAAMSEGVFLLLLVAAMYCVRTQRYLTAGIAAALLAATRAPGILFALFALTFLIRHDGWRSLLAPWRVPERLLPLALAPLGLFLFWGYCFVVTGDAFAQASTVRHGWDWTFIPPWENLPLLLGGLDAKLPMALGAILVVACSGLLIRLRLIEEAIFCIAAVLLVLSGQGATSAFRYWIVLFPAWLALAQLIAGRRLATAVALTAALLLNGFMVYAWTTQLTVAL